MCGYGRTWEGKIWRGERMLKGVSEGGSLCRYGPEMSVREWELGAGCQKETNIHPNRKICLVWCWNKYPRVQATGEIGSRNTSPHKPLKLETDHIKIILLWVWSIIFVWFLLKITIYVMPAANIQGSGPRTKVEGGRRSNKLTNGHKTRNEPNFDQVSDGSVT